MECSGKAMSQDFMKSAGFHETKDQLPGMVRPMFEIVGPLDFPANYSSSDKTKSEANMSLIYIFSVLPLYHVTNGNLEQLYQLHSTMRVCIAIRLMNCVS